MLRGHSSPWKVLFSLNNMSRYTANDELSILKVYRKGLGYQLESSSSKTRFSEDITINPESDMSDSLLKDGEHGNLILMALKLIESLKTCQISSHRDHVLHAVLS